MKKFVYSVALFPATLFLGWVFTSLSERFEAALDEIDFELGLDD